MEYLPTASGRILSNGEMMVKVKVKVNVNVKFALEQAMRSQRGGRGIALLFL